MAFPVQLLVRFWANHHLLDIFQRPLWRVVKGRSKSYVDKVLQGACKTFVHFCPRGIVVSTSGGCVLK
jgi:predicted NAD/FAD-binding protein